MGEQQKQVMDQTVSPKPSVETQNPNKVTEEKDKSLWTRIQEAKQRNRNDRSKCISEVLLILLGYCKTTLYTPYRFSFKY